MLILTQKTKKSILYGTLTLILFGLVGCSSAKRTSGFYRPPGWKSKKSVTGRMSQPDLGKKTDLAQPPEEEILGIASWYGPGFHGKATANGEQYDQKGLTAAHKVLPMDTWVRVHNLENGKSVVVRINDRGPYKPHRIIDLTEMAARKIEMHDKGTAKVRLEILRYPASYNPKAGLKPYKQVVVQLAVYHDAEMALSFKEKLTRKYQSKAFFVDQPKRGVYHVVAGPFDNKETAQKVSEAFDGEGLENLVRSYRK